jgi:hypothetical protein
MTRRGTLAYCLAAWVVGSFVVALLFLLSGGSVIPSALLMTYFFVLIAGAAGLTLFALLLRVAMRLLQTHAIWIWMAAGAALFSTLIILGSAIYQDWPPSHTGLPQTIADMIFAGAAAVRRAGFWQAPIDGAATAAILCLVDRAFANNNARPETTPETKQSPA